MLVLHCVYVLFSKRRPGLLLLSLLLFWCAVSTSTQLLKNIIMQGSVASRLGVVRFVIDLYCKMFAGYNSEKICKIHQYLVKI